MPHPSPSPSTSLHPPSTNKTTTSTSSEGHCTPILTPASPTLSATQQPDTDLDQRPSTSGSAANMSDAAKDKETALETKQDEKQDEKLEQPVDVNASALTTETAKKAQAACKKHPQKSEKSEKKSKKKSKKKADDSTDTNNDGDDESSDTDSSDSSDSDSDSTESDQKKSKKKKKKQKAKRKLKEKEKKKKKKRKVESSSESDSSDSSDEESSSEEEKKKKKKSKKKSKKESSEEEEEEEEEEEKTAEDQLKEEIRAAQQKLLTLQLKGTGQPAKRRALRLGRLADKAAIDKESKGKKNKRGSKVAFKRVDQLWDNSIHNYKLTETVEDPDADEWDQYIFTVRRKFDWENKYTETVVDIKSKPLRDALQHVMDGVKGVSLVQETPVVDPNMLFLYLVETRAYMAELKAQAKTEKKKKARRLAKAKADHLKMLIKYLDKDYSETKKTLYPLLENNTITFDLLWALFKPNTMAYTPTYGNHDEPRAFKIEYATKESSFMKGQWYSVEGRYLEYDGKAFGMGNMAADVDFFKGPRKISSLACYPIQYHRDPEALKTKLIDRGKKFVSLQGMNYKFHKGMAFYKKRRSVIKVNINGRVMVDPAIHRRINPNYPISVVRPKDPDLGDSEEEDSDCYCRGSEDESDGGHEAPRSKLKIVQDKEGKVHFVQVEYDENGNEIVKEDIDGLCSGEQFEFTEEELLIASPVVLGFAFSEKLWLEFTVSGITDIDWNSGAFNSLVLPENQKSIVRALVESHTFRAAENIDDVIQGKGKGLVVVLHGPPGTGKTLTAEGIAELLKRPLYMVSAGELGTDSRTLELELNKILDIAHSWGAVLLLDEADVFLEKRTIQDIHRNALVSIFLRLLEYFQGILFLTTNRVETFDDAFQSRIHVALRYGELNTKAKRTVWKMFLEKVSSQEAAVNFSDKDYDTLARHNLNGRQIKNSVRTAQALALNEKTPLTMEHVTRVLDVAETFDRDLRGGSGYIDAMRSYT